MTEREEGYTSNMIYYDGLGVKEAGGGTGNGETESGLLQQAGRGQSRGGRHEPANLNKKLAMEEAMTNPEKGRELKGINTDSRRSAEEGWEK